MLSSFDKMTSSLSYFLNKTYYNALLLAHGDLDGIVSAVQMRYIFDDNVKEWDVLFTLPHWIRKHTELENYDLIIVVDISVNNRNERMSLDWIKNIKCDLIWWDHHYCPENISDVYKSNRSIVINPDFRSCVSLIKSLKPDKKYPKKVEGLIEEAHKTDQGDGGNLFNWALKINLKADETRYEIYNYGISEGGEMERYCFDRIKRKAIKYEPVYFNTLDLKSQKQVIKHPVSFVDIKDNRDRTVDKTLMAFECYKEGTPFCIIKFLSTDNGDEYITISRDNTIDINLLPLFGLRSGQDFRITVRNKWSDEKLYQILKGAYEKWKKEKKI